MRRIVAGVVLAVATGLVLAAVSAAMSSDKTTTRGTPIVGLAASGTFVAATFDESTTECSHAEIWNAAPNKVTRLGKKAICEAPGGIRGPALIGNRAVWATNVGGNLRDWTVWTATTTSPVPKALATVLGVDSSAPDPVVIGRAGGGNRRVRRRAEGHRSAGERQHGLEADCAGTRPPARLGRHPRLRGCHRRDRRRRQRNDRRRNRHRHRHGHVVRGDGRVPDEDRRRRSGTRSHRQHEHEPADEVPVPKQAKLLDCANGIVIYRVGSTIKGIRLGSGKTATLLTGTKVAAISPKGMAWGTGPVLHWRPAATAFAPLH